MRTKKALVLASISCFPTASKMNALAPENASAFDPSATLYVLESTNPEDLVGGPALVILATRTVLTDDEGEALMPESPIKTSHAGGYKNLPSRKVIGIRTSDGKVFGNVPRLSLPHWAHIHQDAYSRSEIDGLLSANRTARAAAKESAKK